MRTIIAGSRTLGYAAVVEAMRWAIVNKIDATVILSGRANGVDMAGERWAFERKLPVEHYPADWDNLGKRAGYVRNNIMAENADALVAVWDGYSKGTEHMIRLAKNKGLVVYVHTVPL
jgi:hypothetical protein